MKTRLACASALLGLFLAVPAAAQDALAAQTLTEVCFPELIDQIGREPDLLMASSVAYGLDYNQNIEADLSVADVLYKRADNGIYHLEIGGDEDQGFRCVLTLPEAVDRDEADRTVADLMQGREGFHRFPRLGEGFDRLSWSRTDPVDGGEVQRSVGVEAISGDGRVRIDVTVLVFPDL